MSFAPLPAPPPPPADGGGSRGPRPGPARPVVAPEGPAGARLVELAVYNGAPFADHWAYFVRPGAGPAGAATAGVLINAVGDVATGFAMELERSHDPAARPPTTRIPLQWVDGAHFDEPAMLNRGVPVTDAAPVCGFEASACKVPPPEKSLNSDMVSE